MMETIKRKPGRPAGSRDRNNVFLTKENMIVILRALNLMREQSEVVDPEFDDTFTTISTLTIKQFGSLEYLRIIGK